MMSVLLVTSLFLKFGRWYSSLDPNDRRLCLIMLMTLHLGSGHQHDNTNWKWKC